MNTLLSTVCIGVGATAIMDLWAIARRPLLGIAPPNYALVGRWLGHMPGGRFRHDAIANAAAVPGERLIGWIAHYLIGIVFAALLVSLWGSAWIQQPGLWPALAVGVGTVAAPFFLMQPGMGAGVAASRTPKPASARVQSVTNHVVFGVGMYLSALVLRIAETL